MSLSSTQINEIVERVAKRLGTKNEVKSVSRSNRFQAGIYSSLDEAFQAAKTAQVAIRNLDL